MLQRYKTTFNYIRAKCYISPHTLLFCLVFVLGRYHAVHILEIFGEVAGIIETHLVSHLSHRELTLAEQLLSMSQHVMPVYVLNAHDIYWYEIDDEQDLSYAEEHIVAHL